MRVAPRRHFGVRGHDFVLERDGVATPVQLRAGEIHYFRVPEVHWEDRLLRMRAMGLNTVSTYVAWNFHEQAEGVFDFSSERHNLTKFIQLADRLGMLVVLRPGPYICAEWDFGGLPAWMLKHTLRENMKFRTADPQYLGFVDRFWSKLFPQVRPLLVENGGPVAMVQLENEYGHFGNASGAEKAYFDRMEQIARRHLGPNVLLISTDSARHNAAGLGTTHSLLAATNLGPWFHAEAHAPEALSLTATHNRGGPQLIMELWSGWFQTWEKNGFTEKHFREHGANLVEYVDFFLKRNASFTLYMAHGGTNFGFWNAATGLSETQEGLLNSSFITSSYDYSAPISEEGRHGFGGDGIDKYAALRNLMARYRKPWEPPLAPEPAPPRLANYSGDGPGGAVVLRRRVPLHDPAVLAALCDWQAESSDGPTPMEFHGQQAGLAFYRYRPVQNMSSAAAGAGTALLRVSEETRGNFLAKEQQGRAWLKLKVRDRVTVWSADQLLQQAEPVTIYGKRAKLGPYKISVPMGMRHKNADHLDILVEHLGRRAFTKRRTSNLDPESYEDWKGMTEAWLGGDKLVGGWQYCALPLADLYAVNGSVPEPSVKRGLGEAAGPSFFEGRFLVGDEPADTFLRFDAGAWRTGTAFLNGFNLGRYMREARGPFDLYAPKSALRRGENVVVLLEMNPPANMTLAGAAVTFKAHRGPMLP
uniref:Beta-galactosidase n=1 Tax=Alexandrium catenella TaxID=2925 RepID=A0A7S1RL73_ALECA